MLTKSRRYCIKKVCSHGSADGAEQFTVGGAGRQVDLGRTISTGEPFQATGDNQPFSPANLKPCGGL